MTQRSLRFLFLILLAAVGLNLGANGSAVTEPDFAGLVPFSALTKSSLDFFRGGYTHVNERAMDGAFVVFKMSSCERSISDREAVALSIDLTSRFRCEGGGNVWKVKAGKGSAPWYRVLGKMLLFCFGGESGVDEHVVAIRQLFENSRSWYYPFAVGLDRGVTEDSPVHPVPISWTDNWEKPDYLGFLRHEGKAWAFALVANGERLIVFDLQGHVVMDQKSWGYQHLVREGDDVVLYTILIERAPKSAIELMPGKDRLRKEMALGQYRTWALHRIGKGSDQVLTSALVPKFRGPHDDNPEIEKRSAPVVKKARSLFDGFRKEGRIVDELP